MNEQVPPPPTMQERMRDILTMIAVRSYTCPDCGRILFLVPHSSHHNIPYTVDGLNHMLYCPKTPEAE